MGKYNFDDVSKGEGGVYDSINLNGYHYGGNNPIRYVDPDGKTNSSFAKNDEKLNENIKKIYEINSAIHTAN